VTTPVDVRSSPISNDTSPPTRGSSRVGAIHEEIPSAVAIASHTSSGEAATR
jgi:hypothetical protein